MADDAQAPPRTIDWQRIGLDYRAGILSLREIAGQHGITEGAIRKRAKRDSWERDLTVRIQAKAEALVQARAAPDAETERVVVEATALAIVNVRLGHRKDIAKGRTLAMRLLSDLEVQTSETGLLEQLRDAVVAEAGTPREVGRVQEAFERVTSIGGRVSALKALSAAMRNFVALERVAYGMDKGAPPAGPLDGLKHESLRKLLDAIAAARAASPAA